MLTRTTPAGPRRKRGVRIWACLALWACAMSDGAFGQGTAGYPADYDAIIASARDEGKVVVYSTTDLSAVAALIRDFESLYPGVKVDYEDLNSADLHNRYLAENAAHRPSADVLW